MKTIPCNFWIWLSLVALVAFLMGCDDPYKDLNIPKCPWTPNPNQQYIPCNPQ